MLYQNKDFYKTRQKRILRAPATAGIAVNLVKQNASVAGLVQITCIESNPPAASRALRHSDFAMLPDGRHLIGRPGLRFRRFFIILQVAHYLYN